MGVVSSSEMKPEELTAFRKLIAVEDIEIPVRAENRTATDKKGLLLYGIAALIWLPFLIYSLTKLDLSSLTQRPDSCGDFCGQINFPVPGRPCSGKNLIDKPILENGECVSATKDVFGSFGSNYYNRRKNPFMIEREREEKELLRKIPANAGGFVVQSSILRSRMLFGKVGRDSWKFVITVFMTTAFSVSILTILKCLPAAFVWSIITLSLLGLAVITAILWYVCLINGSHFLLVLSWTAVASTFIIVTLFLFKKIRLLIQLYREASKALAAMPMLICVPVVITLVQTVIVVVGAVTIFLLLYCADRVNLGLINVYVLSNAVQFTIVYTVIMIAWSVRLVAGIQFMIISGSVIRWFFTREKNHLRSPIRSSTVVTLKYHFGTVAFGSLLLTLFSYIKAVFRMICRCLCCRCFCDICPCCSCVDYFFNFISENSYIQTAMHGQSYIRSAKRAAKLLFTNAANVVALNCVGDFILAMVTMLLTGITTVISYFLFLNFDEFAALPTIICFFINLSVTIITFVALLQAIIETLFICFCEDSLLNDGESRPYFMSKGLMEFVENSKKIFVHKNGQ